MFIERFPELSIEDKADYILKNGMFLSAYLGKVYMYNLFEVNGFYIEVARDIRDSKIVGVDTFLDTKRLKTYLKEINISELMRD